MAKAGALKRVRADLAAGRTHLAVRRLRSLLADDPNDLDVRRMLAAVYRRTGNLVEAGRWAYLTGDVRPDELAAFSRAHTSPWLRLRLLRWSGSIQDLPDEGARNRLHALVVAAEQYGPPRRPYTAAHPPAPPVQREKRSRIPCVYVSVVLIVFGVLVFIGILRAAAWLVAFINS